MSGLLTVARRADCKKDLREGALSVLVTGTDDTTKPCKPRSHMLPEWGLAWNDEPRTAVIEASRFAVRPKPRPACASADTVRCVQLHGNEPAGDEPWNRVCVGAFEKFYK